MKIKKDKKIDAAYIQFRKGTANKTLKLTDDILVDYDKKGRIIGIEVLSLSELAPALKIMGKSKGKSAA